MSQAADMTFNTLVKGPGLFLDKDPGGKHGKSDPDDEDDKDTKK